MTLCSIVIQSKKKNRIYFTPEQVYNSGRLMKMISLKDAAMRKNGKKYWNENMINGSEYHYVVNTSAFSKGSKKGMLSKDKVTIKGRVGNSLIVKSDNPNLDGKIILTETL